MQKKSRSRFAHSAVLPLAIVVGQVLANPDGGVVVGGQAAISQRPGVTTVNQASNRAVINWRDFSIDPGDLTEFHQPGKDSVALNRVLGNDPSKLLGQLKANGNIWLVNPNGILFGPSAQVDVHGLLATTSDIVDQDFLNGHDNFSIPSPNADASVVNHGNISIGEYGLAGLVAPHVRNAGVIQGRLGQVVIAGAPTFTLDFYGDGLIQFEATSKVTENANSTEPLVRNDGKISVDGGDVLITANAAAGIVDEVINMDGIVEARSVGIENGAIVLQGGDAGIVHVAGHIDASGHDPGDTGGTVKVLGEKVGLFAETEIDASGDSGGGEVLIGGNFQGKGPEPNAKRTYVNGATSIAADALNQGDGGKVIVWSDEVTEFYGDVSANVAAGSGDGGLVEVSGKEALVFEGSVDVFAPHGKKGTVLIDPSNLTIIDAADGGDQDANLITDSQVLFSDPNLGEFNSNTLSWGAIDSLGATANIVIEATGDIVIANVTGAAGEGITSTTTFSDVVELDLTTGSLTIRSTGGEIDFVDPRRDYIRTEGGSITFEALGGKLNGGGFDTTGELQDQAGDVTLVGMGSDLDFGFITTGGGNININSAGGIGAENLTVHDTGINSSSSNGNGGAINITAGTDIAFDVVFLNSSSDSGDGGAIRLTAGDEIGLGSIFGGAGQASFNSSSNSGGGGAISINAGNFVGLQGIGDSSREDNFVFDSSSGSGVAGAISVSARNEIQLSGPIDASSGSGRGGAIELSADEIDFSDPIVNSNNALLIQPSTRNQSIAIGGTGDTSSLDLTDSEQLQLSGFSSITIGRKDGTGTITIAPTGTNFSDPVTLRSPNTGGSIVVNGLVQTNGNPLTLIAGDTVDINDDIITAGGSIDITSGGTIDTTGSFLQSNSTTQAGGDISLKAVGSITTGGQLIAYGTTQGGDISLTSSNGNINIADVLAAGALVTDGEGGELFTTDQGGSITIEAGGNITASEMFSVGEARDGDISIISNGGTITVTGSIGAPILNQGTGGTVILEANGNIVTENILTSGTSGGGNISVVSASGTIDTKAGTLDSSSISGEGGVISLSATRTIGVGDIVSTSNQDQGGSIDLNSGGNITGGSIAFGSLAGLSSGRFTADASGSIEITSELAPNGADTILGADTRPTNILLPDTINTGGGDVTLFVGDAYTFATGLTTIGGDFTLDGLQSVALTAPVQTSGGDVTVESGDTLTLEAPIATSVDQASILLIANGRFVNRVGERALQPGDGRYLVYSSDPAADTRGIPDNQFSKRYNVAFNPEDPQGTEVGLPSDVNFFLYEIAPTLTIVADDASRGFGEPNPVFTFNSSGLIDGDTSEAVLSAPLFLATTAEVASLPGDYPIVIGPTDLTSPLGYTIELVPGNLTVTGAALPDIQNTALLLPTVPVEEQPSPVVPQVLPEYSAPMFAVPDVGSLAESNEPLSSNDGNRELWGPPR